MIKYIAAIILPALLSFSALEQATAEEASRTDMAKNPQRYLEITDWQFYIAARVAIIHHVKIENTADIDYKDVRVKVDYYSNYPKYNRYLSSTSGVLPITVPANSSDVYLKGGTTLGAGSPGYIAKNIRIIGVEPVLE
ncbi:MAG: hypothetical protein GWO07_04540 [Candidatus Dadabacteria bacterium]|nr:hypothetical protein [Candidatus Dadabacteria bacterium]NIS08030.1 hypothetical protein [Candidatus Dadabacteria bacterium]NIV40853.1 hypothetical protein [Candidatus Dadabacteria bacterium]NIY21608.1 hypothetical protein [Candidatus Dadabacteria bacterium]